MENEKQEEEHKQVLPSETEAEKKAGDENESKGLNRDGSQKQDPLKAELEKVNRSGRSKREKLLYTKQRVEEQLNELESEEGVQTEEDDSKPLTVGMFKKIQAESATKTALQLADDIENESERELTKYHIENTIRPTGDPKKDLDLALVHVNAVKNSQILQEVIRKGEPGKIHSNGGGNPESGRVPTELTDTEIPFTKPPFNMTKEAILKARPK